ncbi:MAG: ROK family protein, partial [Clostridia bacterium]|nr:ROK family protein [Clostridia bacterium]
MTDIEDGTEESNLYLGVEIGGTKHQIVLGDKNGNVLCIEKGKVVLEEGAQGILRWMADHIPAMIEKAPSFGGAVRAIGVGFGGIIETATGRSVASVQVKGWKDFMLKSWFEETFRLPAVVLNDTVAGGYGEYICGAGKGSKSFFYTNIGSGIGGVFIRNGEIYDGNGYGASYLGHTYVPDMIEGTSFKQRKVEELCSGWYIEQRLRSPGYVPKESLIMELCGG